MEITAFNIMLRYLCNQLDINEYIDGILELVNLNLVDKNVLHQENMKH
jgi:hypothetical protein